MKKILLLIGCMGMWSCTDRLVYKPAPLHVISLVESVQVTGTVEPWELDFTAVSHWEADHTRLVVLSAIGIKLLDVSIFDDRSEVYFKQAKFPTLAAQAFIRFARASLRTDCPRKNIFYQDTRTHANFKAQIQGGTTCP